MFSLDRKLKALVQWDLTKIRCRPAPMSRRQLEVCLMIIVLVTRNIEVVSSGQRTASKRT